jgi:hypothetical protein
MGRSHPEHTREFKGSATSMLNPGVATPLSLRRVDTSQEPIRFEPKRLDPRRIRSFSGRLARTEWSARNHCATNPTQRNIHEQAPFAAPFYVISSHYRAPRSSRRTTSQPTHIKRGGCSGCVPESDARR